MISILEFDDFNPKAEVNCIKHIQSLVALYPKIKLTLFTSALYERTPLFSDRGWCAEVLKLINSNNIRLAVHGCYHTVEEFKHKTVDDALLTIALAESVFRIAKLPFIKVFRGPHWGINENTYTALDELGYKMVYTHTDYQHLTHKNIINIRYNWNLANEYIPDSQIIIGHGHTHNVCGNGIEESYNRICNFINKNNPEFRFADELD